MKPHSEMMDLIAAHMRSEVTPPRTREFIQYLLDSLAAKDEWKDAEFELPSFHELCDIGFLDVRGNLCRTYAYMEEQPNYDNPPKLVAVWVEWDPTDQEITYGNMALDPEFKVLYWRRLPPLPVVKGRKHGAAARGGKGVGAVVAGGASAAAQRRPEADKQGAVGGVAAQQRDEQAAGPSTLQRTGVPAPGEAAARGKQRPGVDESAGGGSRRLPLARPIGYKP